LALKPFRLGPSPSPPQRTQDLKWQACRGHLLVRDFFACDDAIVQCCVRRTVPNPASALKASRQYATKPHMAGTPGDLTTAKDFLALLQTELGAIAPASEPIYLAGSAESRNATLSITHLNAPTAWIDVYYPVMNTPLNHSVAILGNDGLPVWNAPLEEVADLTDPEAGKYFEAVPTFHGLSKSGEVKGHLVYANYGRQEDYRDLVEKGKVTGRVFLKYINIWLGRREFDWCNRACEIWRYLSRVKG
jgi:N-acetylated-alpha-linked acidic dipeptidase